MEDAMPEPKQESTEPKAKAALNGKAPAQSPSEGSEANSDEYGWGV